jgi:hypothetical protein
MINLQNLASAGKNLILAGTLAFSLTSCDSGPVYETGTVIKENLTEPKIVMINNTEFQVGPREYLLDVITKNGFYILDVKDNIYQHKTTLGLAEAIREGKEIKFKIGYKNWDETINYDFGKDHIGTISSENIEVLE